VTPSPGARRVVRGAEVALAFAAGIAAFALIAVALAVVEADVFAAVLGGACVAAVIVIARRWGVAYAVPPAMAALLAFDWYQFPPTHAEEFPSSGNLANLVVYLAVSVLVGELAASAARRAETSEGEAARLAHEQAALRRVATLVARGVPASEVFAAVAHEAGEVLGVDATHLGRLDPDGASVAVGAWSRTGEHIPLGTRLSTDGQSVSAMVAQTGRPARMDSYDDAAGVIAGQIRGLGIRASVGFPITVDGRLWGLLVASTKEAAPLPADTESRLAAFTELVATALSNTEAREEVHRLADEQAALRRVATVVAREAPPAEVFAAVAEEVARLLEADDVLIERYEADGTLTIVADRSGSAAEGPALTGLPIEGHNVSSEVYRTGRSARIDDYAKATGAVAAAARDAGIRSAIGTPIIVDERLWGVVVVATRRADPLPAWIELRIAEFTELVATAISNVEARAELAESRARLVAAADQERRRVVRDLHDGAQQRLVHTVITLKLARHALERGDDALDHVTAALDNAEQTTAELRELAHGILPAALTRGGLHAGVEALAARMPVPVDNDVSVGRLPATVEATAYFIVAEALTNIAKHAKAGHAAVEAHLDHGTLCLRVRDDGVGGVRLDGSGLVGLRDRLAVVDGSLSVECPVEGGTLVGAEIPLAGHDPSDRGRTTRPRDRGRAGV
jgi:signal transduction histidine kinase